MRAEIDLEEDCQQTSVIVREYLQRQRFIGLRIWFAVTRFICSNTGRQVRREMKEGNS